MIIPTDTEVAFDKIQNLLMILKKTQTPKKKQEVRHISLISGYFWLILINGPLSTTKGDSYAQS